MEELVEDNAGPTLYTLPAVISHFLAIIKNSKIIFHCAKSAS